MPIKPRFSPGDWQTPARREARKHRSEDAKMLGPPPCGPQRTGRADQRGARGDAHRDRNPQNPHRPVLLCATQRPRSANNKTTSMGAFCSMPSKSVHSASAAVIVATTRTTWKVSPGTRQHTNATATDMTKPEARIAHARQCCASTVTCTRRETSACQIFSRKKTTVPHPRKQAAIRCASSCAAPQANHASTALAVRANEVMVVVVVRGA